MQSRSGWRDRALRHFLDPKSVAILGASGDLTKAGGRPIQLSQQLRFSGRIYPISLKQAEIAGLTCYQRLTDVKEPIDLCVVALPADHVESALEQCIEAGIDAVIIFASGFSELDEAGRERQARLSRLAHDNKILLMGPNCMGVINFATGLGASFTVSLDDRPLVRSGPTSFVTQSGAIAGFVLALASINRTRLGAIVTTGNEAVLGFGDYVAALLDDPATRVIAGYMEGVDGSRLTSLGEAALERDKPLVFMKVGSSAAGAAASMAHTGKLVGSERVYSAVFRELGITRAESLEQLLDFSAALELERRPSGDRVGIISTSGGAAILLADWCERLGLHVTSFSEPTQEHLRELLPWFASVGNPLDTTGRPQWDAGLLGGAVSAVANDPNVDLILCHVGFASRATTRIASELRSAVEKTDKPILVSWLPEQDAEPQFELREAGVPIYTDPVRMVRAAGALVDYSRVVKRRKGRSSNRRTSLRADAVEASELLASLPGATVVTEYEAASWLKRYGFRTPGEVAVTTIDKAAIAAARLGYPVCMKLLSPDVVHRSQVGAIRLDLRDEMALREAYQQIVTAVPYARIDGVLISKQAESGIEVIISGFRDPDFGSCILCGFGGVLAEVVDNVAIRRAPVEPPEASEMFTELRGWQNLAKHFPDGVNLDGAADALSRLSRLIYVAPSDISSIEINPLVLYPEGSPLVLDALITRVTAGLSEIGFNLAEGG